MKHPLLSALCFPIGVLLCAIAIVIWTRDATQALLVPFFTLGAGVFFVITVLPEDRVLDDIVVATDCFHIAMGLGGVCLGSALGSTWILIARMDWVPLGAIYCCVVGSTFLLASFRGLRYYFMSF